MKRRLIILRHAKSDWSAGATTDHDRPINRRGRDDAPRIAQRIEELGWRPDRVLSSDARRARETWEHMRDHFTQAPTVALQPELYLAGLDAIRQALSTVPDDVDTVMVIGHNPGWEEAASMLVGRSLSMTTCNAVLISVDADSWTEAAELDSCWRLEAVVRPKEL